MTQGAEGLDWNSAYVDNWAPWDIGRPQPVWIEVADEFISPVLDSGCGTGEQSLMLAERASRCWGLTSLRGPSNWRGKRRGGGAWTSIFVSVTFSSSTVSGDDSPRSSTRQCSMYSATSTERAISRASLQSSSREACSICWFSPSTRLVRRDRGESLNRSCGRHLRTVGTCG